MNLTITGLKVDAGTGEGSRGGKIIGHTSSGKPIYASLRHQRNADKEHGEFSKAEHKEAYKLHMEHAEATSKKGTASDVKAIAAGTGHGIDRNWGPGRHQETSGKHETKARAHLSMSGATPEQHSKHIERKKKMLNESIAAKKQAQEDKHHESAKEWLGSLEEKSLKAHGNAASQKSTRGFDGWDQADIVEHHLGAMSKKQKKEIHTMMQEG